MRDFGKNFSALLLALVALFGILFLPEVNLRELLHSLSFLEKADNTAVAFGYYLGQKAITGVIISLVTIVLYVTAYRTFKKYED